MSSSRIFFFTNFSFFFFFFYWKRGEQQKVKEIRWDLQVCLSKMRVELPGWAMDPEAV